MIAIPVIACLAAVIAQAPSPGSPAARYERPIEVTRPGPHRLAVDPTLLAGAAPFTVTRRGTAEPIFVAEHGLRDLRLAGSDGREVPYLLVYPPFDEPRWLRATAQPLASTEKTSGFEADLGSASTVDAIDVRGLPGSFMKRFSLEASGDRQHWTMVIAEGTLFDLPDQQLRQTSVSFAPGAYRYLRVTWNDTHSGKVPLPAAVAARHVSGVTTPPPVLVPLPIERRPSEPGRSRYHLVLPGPRFPIVALHVDAAGDYIFRQASVTEPRLSAWRAEPTTIGRALLSRDRHTGTTATPVRIVVQQPAQGELDLLVEDGDNPPLDLRGVSAELAQLPWIYFESAGPVVARYGDSSLQPPVYDLEAARASLTLDRVPEARWGPSSALTVEPPPPADGIDMTRTGAPLDTSAFRYTRAIAESQADLLAWPLDAAALAHSAGPLRQFSDVRIVDGAGRQVPWLVERRPEPMLLGLETESVTSQVPELQAGAGSNRSVYRITLPYSGLPDATIVLRTTARLFRRQVMLGFERAADRRHRDPWFESIADKSWEHADQSVAASVLTLPLPRADARELRLVVDERDNSALPIASVQLLLPSYRLRFFRPASAARLVYGRDDLTAPSYDLALLAPRVLGAAATDVTVAPEASGRSTDATPLISPWMFWMILGGAVLVLLGLLVMLLRRV